MRSVEQDASYVTTEGILDRASTAKQLNEPVDELAVLTRGVAQIRQ